MDTKGNAYRWIADLKRQRALRTVQRLGQHMGRLGFDEFEPYRQINKERRIDLKFLHLVLANEVCLSNL